MITLRSIWLCLLLLAISGTAVPVRASNEKQITLMVISAAISMGGIWMVAKNSNDIISKVLSSVTGVMLLTTGIIGVLISDKVVSFINTVDLEK